MMVTRVAREMTRGRMVAGLEKLLSVGDVAGGSIAVVAEDRRAAGDSSMTTVLHVPNWFEICLVPSLFKINSALRVKILDSVYLKNSLVHSI